MCDRLGRFSQREVNHTDATSNTTPPPKKPAACGISCRAPRTSSAIPATLKNISRKGAKTLRRRKALPKFLSLLCVFASLREKSSSKRDPIKRLLVDALPNLLNVTKMHTTAASTPPTAPTTNHNHDTCSRRSVVPTAPTHHVRSPYINNAAYAIAPINPNKLPTPA